MPPAPKKSTLDQKIADAGGSTPVTVMFVCGDAMRRPHHPSSARPEETERALSALSVASAVEALSTVDVSSVKGELLRAMNDAFEAAFADDDRERAPYASSAMKALQARDRIESAVVAAKARLAIAEKKSEAGDALQSAIDSLQQRTADADAELQSKARSLTGVNRERRAELSKLDAGQRDQAWWYAARSGEGDDALLAVLGGADNRPMGDEARADLAASNLPRFDAKHESSAVRRTALGVASESESAWLQARADKNEALKQATALASDASLEDGAES